MDIRKVRKSNGWTQEKLAEKLGINRATLSKYETGQIEPSISMLRQICNILGCHLTEIMSEDEFFGRLDHIIEDEKAYIKNVENFLNTTAAERLKPKADDFLYEENGRIIISAYYFLNSVGQEEAVKRIVELTEIPKYQKNEKPTEDQ